MKLVHAFGLFAEDPFLSKCDIFLTRCSLICAFGVKHIVLQKHLCFHYSGDRLLFLYIQKSSAMVTLT
jgi:hypothetical protein